MGQSSLRNSSRLEISKNSADMGKADTFRYNVLSFVVEENYDLAIKELKSFLDRDSEFPMLKSRVERYIQHGVDLVNAIRAKRKFPGINQLTAAKQQEINDKFVKHFGELQVVLKKVEKIQRDVKLEDVRSTVWVVKAGIWSLIAITSCAFLLDMNQWLLRTMVVVIDDIFKDITVWIFSLF